jgi:hypothetical protein
LLEIQAPPAKDPFRTAEISGFWQTPFETRARRKCVDGKALQPKVFTGTANPD